MKKINRKVHIPRLEEPEGDSTFWIIMWIGIGAASLLTLWHSINGGF